MRSALVGIWLVVLSLGTPPDPARAQNPDPAAEEEPLFTGRDAIWAGGFVLGTVAMAPVDVHIAAAVQDSLLQKNPWIRHSASGLEFLGFPGASLATAGMYVFGRLADRPVLADIGLHATEAVVLAEVFTFATKSLAGRARPHVDVRDPFDFGFGRGFGGDRYQSFPSGHATAAFATAAAVTAEVADRWPDRELLVGTALFGAASLVGASRLYHNMHWASDVVAGAAVGTFAGWKVVGYTHANPDNRVDRWLLGVTIAPTEGGRVARLWIAPGL